MENRYGPFSSLMVSALIAMGSICTDSVAWHARHEYARQRQRLCLPTKPSTSLMFTPIANDRSHFGHIARLMIMSVSFSEWLLCESPNHTEKGPDDKIPIGPTDI